MMRNASCSGPWTRTVRCTCCGWTSRVPTRNRSASEAPLATAFLIRRVFPLTEVECRGSASDERLVRAFFNCSRAEDCLAKLERDVHRRVEVNPFTFGDDLAQCTSFA